ncbi:TRAP transporter large permease [Lampropedia puyangensis]|uniref:TRAP transporter large permease protein n=1 Tax=Lampropedia puyangensis TaxID=1330072 RepID=A0A4S8FD08_9BURK|nr:TRAP transporter large permease [Lampropedia puyangensis]THU04484.1 TRAP transporter large permease [Lampropedia puyangensis]
MTFTAFILLGFFSMLGMIIMGLPIATSMAFVGILGGLAAYGLPFINSIAPVVWGVHNDSLLTAIPLFVMMGELLLRSGIADRMFGAIGAWLGRLPGGLLHANIGCSALFAATSGSSVATAATVGTVALPSLHRRGYRMSSALGSIAAGGTLGILIPPSVNLIVYGSLTDTSIGQLFMAGLIPGLLLAGFFMLWVLIQALVEGNTQREPKVPLMERIRLLKDLIPPGVVFLVVMGSLYSGFATATESAALGLTCALFFCWRSGRLDWTLLQNCFVQTARTSGMILLIMTAAFILNLAIGLTGVAEAMTAWVTSFGLSATATLLMLLMFYLIVGMFMDVMSLMVATVPITFPIVVALGVDPVWFGIFIVIMCELGLITPPVGMNLFVVHGIRPDKGSIRDAIIGAVPYVIVLLLFSLLMIAVPSLATWLPQAMR